MCTCRSPRGSTRAQVAREDEHGTREEWAAHPCRREGGPAAVTVGGGGNGKAAERKAEETRQAGEAICEIPSKRLFLQIKGEGKDSLLAQ